MLDPFATEYFEFFLRAEVFKGRKLEAIKKEFKDRIKYDSDFAKEYEEWLEESGYDSWLEFYYDDEF